MAYKLLCILLPVDIVNKVFDYSSCYDTTKFHMFKFFNIFKISLMSKYMDSDLKYRYTHIINIIKRHTYMYLMSHHDYYGSDGYNDTSIIKRQKIVDGFPKNMRSYVEDRIIQCKKCIGTIGYCSKCDFIVT